ncbi:Protein CBG24206 [Caenorhabditis briggsae]|uniref:G-protein coupled receptors family 1 profile domain-containing protein n=2 Tax=Caenorhabditis briggsae TaxID=6238 RepID=A0AAE9CZ09_CAEBR|nr:Protein CBG24206 [Caenorhabditis briggsae]ULT86915.1 hypothetical protein L3Y34_006568 [Caenorhabditis briggsae]CAP20869.1 Protein CBG24206 [Caenorhabditis briggsae]
MYHNFVPSDFEQFDNSTKEALVIIGNALVFITQYSNKLSFCLAVIGVFMNAFHVFILSKKSAISNVINVILLGIAISDMMNLSVIAEKMFFLIYRDACTLPDSSFITKLLNFLEFMKDDSRRLSTWLGVLMASLRYLILKNDLNPNFDFLFKSSSGWKSLAIASTISFLMSLFYWIRVDLFSVVWVPPKACGYPTNFSMLKYSYKTNELFFSGRETFKSLIAFDGILKIIPAFVLPILAALLVRELKKAEVSRKKMPVSSQSANNSDNTSKLVIIMTITCICAEGPMGIAFVIEGLVADVSALRLLVIYFEGILFTFVILNATTHFFICLGVSTTYKKTVNEFLGYKKPQKHITSINPKISSTSTVSRRQIARIDG